MMNAKVASMMNAKVVGDGKLTLVLAHGYGASQALWDNVLPGLSRRHRVVAFDWSFSGAVVDGEEAAHVAFKASSGTSSSFGAFSDDLISLMDEMKLRDTVFVGHSMSGMIGCIASIKRPDLFARLVLVGASPRYLNAEDYIGGFERSDIDNILSSIESDFTTWAHHFVTLTVGADDPISIRNLRKDFKRMRPETALSVARAVFLSDMRGILGSVGTPCTIVQGTNDVAVPVSVGYYMQSAIRGQTAVELIEMGGHFPQLTAPQQFLDVIDKVLVPN